MGRAYDISNDLYMALQAQIGDEGELTNHVIHIIQSECTPYRDYDLNELIFHQICDKDTPTSTQSVSRGGIVANL